MRKAKRVPDPAPFVFLRDVLPELSKSLHMELWKAGYRELAQQVRELRIYRRCGCGETPCGTFYCVSREEWKRLREFDAAVGITCVNAAKGKITRVETLDAEVDIVLRRLFPDPETFAE